MLGKVPYSIDSDKKLYCPANICFRLPHWHCRLGTSDLVFTGCPATEELEITGTFNFYYWNTGKLYPHAGKFCVFWNIGKRVTLAQRATWDLSYEEGEKRLLFIVSVSTCGYASLTWKCQNRTVFLLSRCEVWWWGFRRGCGGCVCLFLIKPVALQKRIRFSQFCSICSIVPLYKISPKSKTVSTGQSRLRFSMGCGI